MSLFARHRGRHVRHGSPTGWGGLGGLINVLAAHPVVDARITRPALFRADDIQPIYLKDLR